MNWEQIGVIIGGAIMLFVFLPGISHKIKNSPKGSRQEWLNLLFIIGLVVLFVLFLIKMV